jgi:hypothetical protein
MMRTVGSDPLKIVATVRDDDRSDEYECEVSTCPNPVCTCSTVFLDLTPSKHPGTYGTRLPVRRVAIDLEKHTLGYEDVSEVPVDDLRFAQRFVGELDDDDFDILHQLYFKIKNELSEAASPDSIDADFDYDAVERSGLMYAYSDVLPFGDQLPVRIGERQCVVFDQYCLLPTCPGSETVLHVAAIDTVGDAAEDLCAIALDYRKKKWELTETYSSPATLETVRSAIEDQIPDFYRQLSARHKKLKAIYARCRGIAYSSKAQPPLWKAGRNDSCPCGSGKKHKKCCLGQSTG